MLKSTTVTNLQCTQCETWADCPFKGLAASQLELLYRSKACLHFDKHQVIFAANTKPLGIYCIKKGTVKLTTYGTQPGIQQILHIAKRGEILGMDDVINDEMLHYHAETLEETEICLIDKTTFLHLVENNPALARELLMRASHAVKERDQTISRLSHYNVRERTAQTLLSLTSDHGKKTRHGIKLELNLSRKEIAQLTGTVQESVVRVLSDFKKEGLIGLNKREITIFNQTGLARVYTPDLAG